METRLSILFYGKKSLQKADKLLAIYLRVTINGQRFEVSTQRYVETAKWSAANGKMKGNSEEARSLNQYLDSLRQRVYEYQTEYFFNDRSAYVYLSKQFKQTFPGICSAIRLH